MYYTIAGIWLVLFVPLFVFIWWASRRIYISKEEWEKHFDDLASNEHFASIETKST